MMECTSGTETDIDQPWTGGPLMDAITDDGADGDCRPCAMYTLVAAAKAQDGDGGRAL